MRWECQVSSFNLPFLSSPLDSTRFQSISLLFGSTLLILSLCLFDAFFALCECVSECVYVCVCVCVCVSSTSPAPLLASPTRPHVPSLPSVKPVFLSTYLSFPLPRPTINQPINQTACYCPYACLLPVNFSFVMLEAKTEKLWVEKKRKQSQEQGDGGKNARGEKKTSKGEIVIYRAAYSRVMVMGSKGGWGGKQEKGNS